MSAQPLNLKSKLRGKETQRNCAQTRKGKRGQHSNSARFGTQGVLLHPFILHHMTDPLPAFKFKLRDLSAEAESASLHGLRQRPSRTTTEFEKRDPLPSRPGNPETWTRTLKIRRRAQAATSREGEAGKKKSEEAGSGKMMTLSDSRHLCDTGCAKKSVSTVQLKMTPALILRNLDTEGWISAAVAKSRFEHL